MISDEQKFIQSAEWQRLLELAEKERLAGRERVAQSYENSAARIETRLQREDVDPSDYVK